MVLRVTRARCIAFELDLLLAFAIRRDHTLGSIRALHRVVLNLVSQVSVISFEYSVVPTESLLVGLGSHVADELTLLYRRYVVVLTLHWLLSDAGLDLTNRNSSLLVEVVRTQQASSLLEHGFASLIAQWSRVVSGTLDRGVGSVQLFHFVLSG